MWIFIVGLLRNRNSSVMVIFRQEQLITLSFFTLKFCLRSHYKYLWRKIFSSFSFFCSDAHLLSDSLLRVFNKKAPEKPSTFTLISWEICSIGFFLYSIIHWMESLPLLSFVFCLSDHVLVHVTWPHVSDPWPQVYVAQVRFEKVRCLCLHSPGKIHITFVSLQPANMNAVLIWHKYI